MECIVLYICAYMILYEKICMIKLLPEVFIILRQSLLVVANKAINSKLFVLQNYKINYFGLLPYLPL